jgi:hypothetical protein
MITKDFYGKNSFVWWTGIVEDRYDPLKLGQVRVRIFGLHTDNESYIKTEDLPWAQVLHPTNGSNKNSTMVEGDWVFGFFQDGDYAQIPVVMGVFPGIQSIQSETIYKKTVIKKNKQNFDVPESTQVDRQVGEPTTKRLHRSVVDGSLIQVTNNNRSHVCDIKSQVDWVVEHITGFFSKIVQIVRSGIRAVLVALGFDPSGQFSKIVQLVKSINAIATKILRTLEKITEGIRTVVRLVQQVRAMIDYILSLPEKLRRLLRDCLAKLYAQIAAGIGSILADPDGATGQFFGESSESFDELSQEISKLGNESKKILNELVVIGTSPEVIVQSFINPSSTTDFNQAEKNFGNFIDNIYVEGDTQNNDARFNDERYQVP